jgi:nitrite reductase/ring-hydroxylating ferredoxin subunit
VEIEVGPVSEMTPGSVRVVAAGDREVAVFNTREGLYALDNTCAHLGGPLADGWVADGLVTCPWHWWRYELATGRRRGSDVIGVSTHPVSVREGTVVVEVPDTVPAPVSIRERLLRHARDWEDGR